MSKLLVWNNCMLVCSVHRMEAKQKIYIYIHENGSADIWTMYA